jgi:hypothetical protein
MPSVPKFIGPIVDRVLAVLQARTPALCEAAELRPFLDYGKQFTGVTVNCPSLWVMPERSRFDPDQTGPAKEAHQLTIKFAVSAMTPDEVAAAAMAYMQVIHLAILQSDPADWTDTLAEGTVQRVFLASHEYGPLYQRGASIARFPELALIVEVEELL